MTASTATYAWYTNWTLVTAIGTLAEVCTELTTGAVSNASLQHREDLVFFSAPSAVNDPFSAKAVWWTPISINDWRTKGA